MGEGNSVFLSLSPADVDDRTPDADAGDGDRAMAYLHVLADRGFDDALEPADFASLAQRDDYRDIARRLDAASVVGAPALHAWLALHVSAPLHTLASAHEVPTGWPACRHPMAGEQLSAVQALASLQSSGLPATQALAPLHVSAPLQRFPSSHGVPCPTGACWQPVAVEQKSVDCTT